MSELLSPDPAEQKRAICKALTRVVRNGPLASTLDPKAFFMMLNANYAVLYRDEHFDLNPLWEALSAQHSTTQLTGLFIRFAETLQKRGLHVVLPPQVSDLTLEQQRMHLDAFETSSQTIDTDVEAETMPLTDELFEAEPSAEGPAPLLQLSTGDLKPVVEPDADLKREIVQAVITSVKAAPIGERVDSSQLAYLIDSNFDSLYRNSTFDLDPILQGLRDLGNVFDRDLFLAPALLKEALRPHNIAVRHQRLDVSEAEARQLIEQHYKAIAQAKREQQYALTHTADTQAPPAEPTSSVNLPRAEARKTQLRTMGLGRSSGRVAQRVRIGLMLVVLVGIAAPAYLLRPSRQLSTSPYATSVPLKSAQLNSGVFVGILDEAKWWALPLDQRKARMRVFEAEIARQGFAPDCQVFDEKRRLLVTSVGSGKLRGARC